jgi:hypothetical protein
MGLAVRWTGPRHSAIAYANAAVWLQKNPVTSFQVMLMLLLSLQLFILLL